MNAKERLLDYLDKNPKDKVQISEGNKTKSMDFGGALIVQFSDVCFVRIGSDTIETDYDFYDIVFGLLVKNPLKS